MANSSLGIVRHWQRCGAELPENVLPERVNFFCEERLRRNEQHIPREARLGRKINVSEQLFKLRYEKEPTVVIGLDQNGKQSDIRRKTEPRTSV